VDLDFNVEKKLNKMKNLMPKILKGILLIHLEIKNGVFKLSTFLKMIISTFDYHISFLGMVQVF
jgi:hypothetical protein